MVIVDLIAERSQALSSGRPEILIVPAGQPGNQVVPMFTLE